MKIKTVFGIGKYTKGSYSTRVDGKAAKEYVLWTSMLRRCYSEAYQAQQPTYIGCTVGDEFKDFQVFSEWCQTQGGFKEHGWQLDKDILYPGNKVYSGERCIFIPQELNLLLGSRKSKRGEYPVGVVYHKMAGKFMAGGNFGYFGLHSTPELAFYAYKVGKEHYVKGRANAYKHVLDSRAYEALMRYEVSITD